MATKRLFREYMKWTREFPSVKFRSKLAFNIREAFDAEIRLLNDVNAPQTLQTQRELRDLLRSQRSKTTKNFRPPAQYQLDGSVPLSSEAEQLERGRRYLATLRELARIEHTDLLEFLLDEQHFTARKSSLVQHEQQQQQQSSHNQTPISNAQVLSSTSSFTEQTTDVEQIIASAKVISNRKREEED